MASVAEALQQRMPALTRAERQVADAILKDYPVSGLGSITELAAQADVSTPTLVRMVQKLGFAGYPAFQAALRAELSEMISDPLSKRETLRAALPEGHAVARFAAAATENIQRTLDTLDPVAFDAATALIADPDRRVYVAGGRITGTLARYLFLHLQMIRPGVQMIGAEGSWPHALLDLAEGDVLCVFDVRRYENQTLSLGEMAHARGARIVLFTDQWRSPLTQVAEIVFSARISAPSAWDSGLASLLLVESLIAAVQETLWDSVKPRIDALESAFDTTRLFRKFT